MLRRLVVTALATTATAALAASPTALAASPLPLPPLPLLDGGGTSSSHDHLTVTVTHNAETDGTYELECHPAGGNHPQILQACDRLDRLTTKRADLFAPVPPDARCTMIYGGGATARVTGTWAGHPVDTTFSRRNGCEMARWDTFVPLLPGAR
ncbi:SSI family serine proteinase inhibitor [Streptomyces sp. NPDC058301]|uniref:SSI family serine proteinase inhibitor n=1 Tax=Streptomyces sp. NPDC058301 TaxID=3346436 RepID=UPI0036EF251F